MGFVEFPVIDPVATGRNILTLRRERGLTVRDLQAFFGFEEPQAIYRWQYGKTLPSVDNLFALSVILEVPMERILVRALFDDGEQKEKQQDAPAASAFFRSIHKEIRVDETDLLFVLRLAHYENNVRIRFACACRRALRR